MKRRSFLAAGSLLSARAFAAGDEYPARPVQVIVPYAAGGADSYVRPLQPGLEKKHGITLVIESVPGAGGAVGSARVKRSAPDGYTVLFCGSGALTIAPKLQDSGAPVPADFTPVVNLTTIPYVIAVRKDSPIQGGREFLEFVKRNPGKLNYGSAGTGSAPHLGMEALAMQLQTSVVHVPYAGIAASIPALLGGHIDAIIGAPSNVLPQIRAGALRGLAVSGRQRFRFAPELPTLAELGADVDVVTHFGFFAPKGVPPAVVQKLASAIADVAREPAYAQTMEAQQTPVDLLPADALARALGEESRRFEPVIAVVKKK